LDFILSLGGLVDWVALSFVQKPSDMEEFRRLAGDKIKLMAKLEKPSAIDSLEEVRCCWACVNAAVQCCGDRCT
jgi:pyruvate kinase